MVLGISILILNRHHCDLERSKRTKRSRQRCGDVADLDPPGSSSAPSATWIDIASWTPVVAERRLVLCHFADRDIFWFGCSVIDPATPFASFVCGFASRARRLIRNCSKGCHTTKCMHVQRGSTPFRRPSFVTANCLKAGHVLDPKAF